LAIEFEAFEAGTKDKLRKPVNVNKGDVCAVGADNGSRPESKSNNGESEKKSEASGDSKYSPDQKYNAGFTSFDKSTVECRYCKKLGHFKNDCRKLKWKLEKEKNAQKESSSPNQETANKGN
jgi:hypothetical protein